MSNPKTTGNKPQTEDDLAIPEFLVRPNKDDGVKPKKTKATIGQEESGHASETTAPQGPDGGASERTTDPPTNGHSAEAGQPVKPNSAAPLEPDLPDPFDPEAYRMPPEGEPVSGVIAQPTRIKVRKPKKGEFFRAHPELRFKASVLEKEDGLDKVYYLVKPLIAVLNMGEFRLVELCLCINRDGGLFVWPIPQPDESGKANDWNTTARVGAQQALSSWVRLKSDKPNSQYVVITAPPHIPEPTWPKENLRGIIARAFGADGLIEDEDHPAMKALRGA